MSLLLAFDFDNTLCRYDGKWGGEGDVSGPPVPGAIEALRAYKTAGFGIAIYSSRSRSDAGRAAMVTWLYENGVPYSSIQLSDVGQPPEGWSLRGKQTKIRFPFTKPPAFIYFDDRNYPPWDGQFPAVEELERFQAWWEREKQRCS